MLEGLRGTLYEKVYTLPTMRRGGGGRPSGGKGGGGKGGNKGGNPNYPSTTGNPSGGGRGNTPKK